MNPVSSYTEVLFQNQNISAFEEKLAQFKTAPIAQNMPRSIPSRSPTPDTTQWPEVPTTPIDIPARQPTQPPSSNADTNNFLLNGRQTGFQAHFHRLALEFQSNPRTDTPHLSNATLDAGYQRFGDNSGRPYTNTQSRAHRLLQRTDTQYLDSTSSESAYQRPSFIYDEQTNSLTPTTPLRGDRGTRQIRQHLGSAPMPSLPNPRSSSPATSEATMVNANRDPNLSFFKEGTKRISQPETSERGPAYIKPNNNIIEFR